MEVVWTEWQPVINNSSHMASVLLHSHSLSSLLTHTEPFLMLRLVIWHSTATCHVTICGHLSRSQVACLSRISSTCAWHLWLINLDENLGIVQCNSWIFCYHLFLQGLIQSGSSLHMSAVFPIREREREPFWTKAGWTHPLWKIVVNYCTIMNV